VINYRPTKPRRPSPGLFAPYFIVTARYCSTPGQGVIKSPWSTQLSIPPGYINRVPTLLAGVKAGCVHLCRVASNIV